MFRKKTKIIFLYSLSLMAFFAVLLSSAGAATAATFSEKCTTIIGTLFTPAGSGTAVCRVGGENKTEAEIDAMYKCFDDSDCDDGKNDTVDTCDSKGTTSAICRYEASQCTSDSQCDDNKPDTYDVCVLSDPTKGVCVSRADECSIDADCDDDDGSTNDLCKKEDQRPWMACYNLSKTESSGGLDENFMTYILIIAILAIGIKTTLSLTAEVASAVNKTISGATGGKIKGVGQIAKGLKNTAGYYTRKAATSDNKLLRYTGLKSVAGAALTAGSMPGMITGRFKAAGEKAKKDWEKQQSKGRVTSAIQNMPLDSAKVDEKEKDMRTWSMDAIRKAASNDGVTTKDRTERSAALQLLDNIDKGKYKDIDEKRQGDFEKLRDEFKAAGVDLDKKKFRGGDLVKSNKAAKSLKEMMSAGYEVNAFSTAENAATNLVGMDRQQRKGLDYSRVSGDTFRNVKQARDTAKTEIMSSIGDSSLGFTGNADDLYNNIVSGDDAAAKTLMSQNGVTDVGKQEALLKEIREKNYDKVIRNANDVIARRQSFVSGMMASNFKNAYADNSTMARFGGRDGYNQQLRSKMDAIKRAGNQDNVLSLGLDHFADLKTKVKKDEKTGAFINKGEIVSLIKERVDANIKLLDLANTDRDKFNEIVGEKKK